ncbi:MAG: ABC transporter permease [Acidimicrobiales bacterium]
MTASITTHDTDRTTGPSSDRSDPPRRRPRIRLPFPVAFTAPSVLLLMLGLVGPTIILLGYSFGFLNGGTPGIGVYTDIVTDDFYMAVLLRTLRLAVAVTAITALVGVPMAMIVARTKGLARTALIVALVAPLLTNIVVRNLGWVILLADNGIVNTVLGANVQIPFLGNSLGIGIALVHVCLPLMVLPLLASIEAQDPSHREAAIAHGAHPAVAFWRITFPRIFPGIVAGATLTFVLAVASLVSPILLGRGRIFVLSTLIVQQISTLRWDRAAALAMILFVISVVAVLVVGAISGRLQGSRAGKAPDGLRRRLVGQGLLVMNRFADRPGAVTAARWVFATTVVVFLLLPLLVVMKSAVDSSSVLNPGFESFTTRWLVEALEPGNYLPSFLLSLRLALFTVAICFAVALPVSIVIARKRFPGRQGLLAFLLSPLLLPQTAMAVGFVLFFQFLGTRPSFERLLFAHVIVAFPYLVRVLVSALEGVDDRLEEAARSLGARPTKAFRRVTLPLIKPGIFAGVLFAFLASFDEATVGVLVASSSTSTLPVKLLGDLEVQYTPVAAAVCALLIVVTAVVLVPLERKLGITSRAVGGPRRTSPDGSSAT